ncbi:NTE family protein [Desulfitispora alkaliphila]|uniref:patatin-like phospholipase family protein n=1 Tax=Desulfitispora alkaliphila TaxID=622674 RepID=UPI003D2343E3
MSNNRKKVGLALGSGAVKGYAHIGAIKALKKANIPIDVVTGTSAGAVVGSFLAADLDWEILEGLVCQINRGHVVDITVPRVGFVEGKRVYQLLKVLTKNYTFDQLTVPFTAVATDIEAGELVELNTGEVAKAVRASIAIPGVFKPITIDGKVLVDGAVMERVPVLQARKLGADIVIAIDLKQKTRKIKVRSIIDIMIQSLELMEGKVDDNWKNAADILIKPELPHVSTFDFRIAQQFIDIGEEVMEKNIDKIKSMIY